MNYIEFPKLGIHLNIDPIAFSIGNIHVRWYGIIIATAIMVSLMLALRDAKKYGIHEDRLVDMFLIALPSAVVAARIFFVIFTWDNYKNNLLGIFRVWEGGLAIYGVIIGAFISVALFARHHKMNLWTLADFACVYLPLSQAIGRYGNFANQELYGGNTESVFGMTGSLIQLFPNPGVDGTLPVHPTFLYESMLNLLVFTFLIFFRKRSKHGGQVFALYIMSYSVVRFMMEFLRTDVFDWGVFRANQVFALLMFVAGLLLFILRRKAPSAYIYQKDGILPETSAPSETTTDSDTAPTTSAYSEVLKDLKNDETIDAEHNDTKDDPEQKG